MNRLAAIVTALATVLAIGAVSAGIVGAQSDDTATPAPTTDSVSPPATDSSGDATTPDTGSDATTPDGSDTGSDATTPEDGSGATDDHRCPNEDSSTSDGTSDGSTSTDTTTTTAL